MISKDARSNRSDAHTCTPRFHPKSASSSRPKKELKPKTPKPLQVQRSADDPTVLVVTYEHMHNHPLSSAAAPMAEATSSLASSYLCNVTSSKPNASAFAGVTASVDDAHGEGLLAFRLLEAKWISSGGSGYRKQNGKIIKPLFVGQLSSTKQTLSPR
jgi:hypothetical protein